MFPRPYVLPAVFLLVTAGFALAGFTALAGSFFVLSVGLALWALGTERAIRPLMWFGAGIAGFATLLVARLVFFS